MIVNFIVFAAGFLMDFWILSWDVIISNLSIFRDIVVSAAAILTAWAAWRGLNTWREQLKVKKKSEQALNFLMAVYRLNTILKKTRINTILKNEVPLELQDAGDGKDEERKEYVFEFRVSEVEPVKEQFEFEYNKTMMIFGNKLEKKLAPCYKQHRKCQELVKNELYYYCNKLGIERDALKKQAKDNFGWEDYYPNIDERLPKKLNEVYSDLRELLSIYARLE